MHGSNCPSRRRPRARTDPLSAIVATDIVSQGRIGFLSIPALVEEALQRMSHVNADSLDALLAADAAARKATHDAISRKVHP